MDLERQIQILIEQAPQDGVTPTLMRIIAPLLQQVASQLGRKFYYILQSGDGRWVTTTLSNRQQPNVEKTVVYAFPSFDDAQAHQTNYHAVQSLGVSGQPGQIPVIHLLFQLIALPGVDSAIFFEPDQEAGTEIICADLKLLVQDQIQAYQAQPRSIPRDLA